MEKQIVEEKQIAKGYLEVIKAQESETEGRLGRCIISTETVDRMGDEIMADGWDFKDFFKNPRLLWSHNSGWDEDRPSIGRVENVEVENGKVYFTPVFDLKDSFAAEIYRKYKDNFLNAFSVGFRALEYTFTDTGVKFLKQEALEFSCVNVPANAEALAKLKSMNFEVSKDFKDWSKEAKPISKDDPSKNGGAGDDEAEDDEKDRKEGWKSFDDLKLEMIKIFGQISSGAITQEEFEKQYSKLVEAYKKFNRLAPEKKHFEMAILKVAAGRKIKGCGKPKKPKKKQLSPTEIILGAFGLSLNNVADSNLKD